MMHPTQYLLVGLPFSGKTTLAKKLEKQLGFKRVNIDELKTDFGYGKMDDDHVPDEVWKKVFEEIDTRVIAHLKNGFNVLTETAWRTKTWRDKARILPAEEGFETKVIYVVVDKEVARKRLNDNRITQRRFDIPDTIFDEAVEEFETPTEDENVLMYNGKIQVEEWIRRNLGSESSSG